jgi:hypothetical protein
VAAVVAAVVALSFGLALATGTNNRDGGEASGPAGGGQPTDLPTDIGDLEGADAGAGGGGTSGGDTGGGEPTDLPTDLGDVGGGSTGTSGTSGGTSGTSGTDSGGTTGYDTAPPPDPTLDAYKSVQAGDCLANWMTGETTWASETPEVVACGADNAGVWVSETSDDVSVCPVDAGRSYLSYSSGYENVALCVTRQFEVEQCFLGTDDGSANLMSWFDCGSSSLPTPYTLKYNVTGVYSAPANITGNECMRVDGDTTEYWYWTVDGGSTLLCAVIY